MGDVDRGIGFGDIPWLGINEIQYLCGWFVGVVD